jgi:hypothetical protein
MSDYDDDRYEYGRGENDMEYLYQNQIDYQDNRALDLFDEEGKMIELGVKITREDPVQRFTTFVRSVARTMSSDKTINLTTHEIQFIVDQIDKIPTPEYKNATGFVIGYWLVSSETSYNMISKKRFKMIKPNLKNIEYPVEEQDVIRYARFWISHDLLPEI